MREIAIQTACVGGERSIGELHRGLQQRLQHCGFTRINADQKNHSRKSALIRGERNLGRRVFPAPPASNSQLTSTRFAPKVEVVL
jgi:hypothetical protein